jgi:PDZ domain
LLDSAGRLIGVNTAIYSPSGSNVGIGFAIPVDIVNCVVPQLIRDGRVPTPGIGIVAGNEALAARLGVDGVVIVRTVPGSAAERAGLRGVDTENGQPGDVIVAADGKPVHRLVDLTDELEQIGVGKTVNLTVERGGNERVRSPSKSPILGSLAEHKLRMPHRQTWDPSWGGPYRSASLAAWRLARLCGHRCRARHRKFHRLTDVAFGASTTLGYSANGAGTGGMLSINDGSNSANIALLCNYIAGSFVAANDGHGGTMITDPATIASNQPQLTQSHA